MKAILISTDGFSIETEEFSSAEEATITWCLSPSLPINYPLHNATAPA